MAGNFPDPPGHRIPYDRDGSVAYRLPQYAASVGAQLSQADLNTINNENPDDWSSEGAVLFFPRLMDIVALMAGWGGGTHPIEWSPNTTSGVDGTWSSIPGATWRSGLVKTEFRTLIDMVSLTGVKAIRTYLASGGTNVLRYVHVYGTPSAGESEDRLEIWHPTLDERLSPAALDWGDAVQGSDATRQFRVKNLSAVETASAVEVTREALTDTDFRDTLTMSDDGSTFATSVAIGDLAPGAISPLLYVRRQFPTTISLSVKWSRLVAVATGGWA